MAPGVRQCRFLTRPEFKGLFSFTFLTMPSTKLLNCEKKKNQWKKDPWLKNVIKVIPTLHIKTVSSKLMLALNYHTNEETNNVPPS